MIRPRRPIAAGATGTVTDCRASDAVGSKTATELAAADPTATLGCGAGTTATHVGTAPTASTVEGTSGCPPREKPSARVLR